MQWKLFTPSSHEKQNLVHPGVSLYNKQSQISYYSSSNQLFSVTANTSEQSSLTWFKSILQFFTKILILFTQNLRKKSTSLIWTFKNFSFLKSNEPRDVNQFTGFAVFSQTLNFDGEHGCHSSVVVFREK